VAITKDASPKIFTHNPFFNKTEIFSGKPGKFHEVFNDKLRNLNGYEYEVFLRTQSGRIDYVNGTLRGATAFFLNIFLEKQNARFKVKHYQNQYALNYTFQSFMTKFDAGEYDLVLTSNILKTETNSDPICSFYPCEYCVAVPTTYIRNSFEYSLDNEYTIGLGIQGLAVIFLSMAIWSFIYFKKLSRSPDSPGHFLFAILGFFVGQGVNFRKLCMLQICLVQLFVFALFFLGNLYTATVISIQGQDKKILEINSFADIKKHNLSVQILPQDYKILNESNYDPVFIKSLKLAKNPNELHEAVKNRKAVFARCVAIEVQKESTFRYARDSYYTIDEKISSNFEYFYYNRLNPYRLKFQYYNNAVFEAGLEHYYQLTEGPKKSKPVESIQEEFVTRFEDLYFILIVFFIGNFIAFLVFILEIVWFRLSNRFLKKRKVENVFAFLP
jgi:hypothetical protein